MRLVPGTGHWNMSPGGFHLWATQFHKCGKDALYSNTDKFSPVPYFLLCLAIELEIKSKLLNRMSLEQVKHKFGHKILKAYEELDTLEKVLNEEEECTLRKASELYDVPKKQFEYFCVLNAVKGYKEFPNLTSLSAIANKLIGGVIHGDGDIAD